MPWDAGLVSACDDTWGQPHETGNIRGLLSNSGLLDSGALLNIRPEMCITNDMKTFALSLTLLIATALAGAASADVCYADYKAKQDSPLRLHYGVARLDGTCEKKSALQELTPRLATEGWTLLTIVSVFGEEGLAQRKDSAGKNYLRF